MDEPAVIVQCAHVLDHLQVKLPRAVAAELRILQSGRGPVERERVRKRCLVFSKAQDTRESEKACVCVGVGVFGGGRGGGGCTCACVKRAHVLDHLQVKLPRAVAAEISILQPGRGPVVSWGG